MSEQKTRIIGSNQDAQLPETGDNKTVAISTNEAAKTTPIDVQENSFANKNIAGTRILEDIPYEEDKVVVQDDGKTRLIRPKLNAEDLANDPDYSPTVGWVVVVDGCGKGKYCDLKHGYNFVGKDASQDVCLNFGDDTISREKHIKILYDEQDKKFYVAAGESKNLARLNGKLFDGLTSIKNYDRIKVGNTELLFIALCSEEFSW